MQITAQRFRETRSRLHAIWTDDSGIPLVVCADRSEAADYQIRLAVPSRATPITRKAVAALGRYATLTARAKAAA